MTGSALNERGVFVATRESAIYVVYDYGGEWEDAWESDVIAFREREEAELCAAKRARRRKALGEDDAWDYCGSSVREVPLVEGDRREKS